jgi:hypothetical protein
MKKILILFFAPLFMIAVKPVFASGNASLSLSPVGGTYKVGEVYKLEVFVHPNNETIDTIRVNLNFPADLIKAEGIAKNAAYSFTSGGNILDNEKGIFSFGSGIPEGTTKESKFLTLSFRIKKEGKANILLGADSIVAGNGTSKFNGLSSEASPTFKKGSTTNAVAAVKKYPDGTFLKSLKTKRIYLLAGGQKKYISSPVELRSYGKIKIESVDDNRLAQYPDFAGTAAKKLAVKNGDLVKSKSDRKIYLITNGKKKYIPSVGELKKYRGKRIVDLTKAEIERYPSEKIL